eukprot:7839858-Ditylum_brightwellii.AAC.1
MSSCISNPLESGGGQSLQVHLPGASIEPPCAKFPSPLVFEDSSEDSASGSLQQTDGLQSSNA